jgi:hypothetical protein
MYTTERPSCASSDANAWRSSYGRVTSSLSALHVRHEHALTPAFEAVCGPLAQLVGRSCLALARHDELELGGSAAGELPLSEIGSERREQAHNALAGLSGVDAQSARDVAPAQSS